MDARRSRRGYESLNKGVCPSARTRGLIHYFEPEDLNLDYGPPLLVNSDLQTKNLIKRDPNS